MKRAKPRIIELIVVGVTVFVTFLVSVASGIPKNFVGDDALLLQASKSEGGFASSVIYGFNDVGQGKWRPAFTTLVPLLLKLFGGNYVGYAVVNALILGAAAMVVPWLLRELGSTGHLVPMFAAVVVLVSPFAWYSVWSPYGIMERSALLAMLVGIVFGLRALRVWSVRDNYLSSLFLLVSACFHERYLAVALPVASVLWFRKKGSRAKFVMPWFISFGGYVALKVGILRLSLLTGGGEIPLSESRGTWIIGRYLTSLRATLGLSSGENIYFNLPELHQMGSPDAIRQALFLATMVVLAMIFLSFSHQTQHSESSGMGFKALILAPRSLSFLMVVGCGLALLLPASTVVSRIEVRWLYGSQVLYIILLSAIAELTRNRNIRRLVASALIFCLIGALSAMASRGAFEAQMRRADKAIRVVKSMSVPDGDWTLAIRDNEFGSDQWPWMLGYGYVFSHDANPPSRIQIGFAPCADRCVIVDTTSDSWHVQYVSYGQR